MARGGGDFPGEAGYVGQVLWRMKGRKHVLNAVPYTVHRPVQSGPDLFWAVLLGLSLVSGSRG
jgi:hypothetical protein